MREFPMGCEPFNWFYLDSNSIEQRWRDNKEEFHALIEKIGIEQVSIILLIHISLKTGGYVMSEVILRKPAVVAIADQLPLDYLFSLWDGLKMNSIIKDHDPNSDDDKYMTCQLRVW